MSMELIELIVIRIVSSLASIIELCAAFIIISAGIRAFFGYIFKALFQKMPREKLAEQRLRIELGFALSLALEFELGADILKTAVAPNWQAIGVVASIIVLRTALNYFLQKELEQAERGKRKTSEKTP
ncbi:MAG: DUF1622 domain-containing protein [bacterium]